VIGLALLLPLRGDLETDIADSCVSLLNTADRIQLLRVLLFLDDIREGIEPKSKAVIFRPYRLNVIGGVDGQFASSNCVNDDVVSSEE